MSKRQERKINILKYIQEKITADGYPPSIREIGKVCSISSTSVVYSLLSELAEENQIIFEKNKKRAISLVQSNRTSSIRVPIVGTVPAGVPILAQENIEDYLPFCSDRNPDELFALNVIGTSMVGAGILDGDIVVVEKSPCAENGEIVVAMIDGEATVKRFYQEPERVRLQPENPEMAPIFAQDVTILGKVISCIRYYH